MCCASEKLVPLEVSTLPQTWQEHVQLRPSILSSGETVQASASVREPAPTPSVLVALCDNQGCSAVSKFVSRAPAKKRQLRGFSLLTS